MNIARWFSAYRLLENALAREQQEVARLRVELLEWQNKTLAKLGVTPLFQPPPKPVEPKDEPPIGPRAKQAFLAKQTDNSVLTAEQILGAAAKRNGNQ